MAGGVLGELEGAREPHRCRPQCRATNGTMGARAGREEPETAAEVAHFLTTFPLASQCPVHPGTPREQVFGRWAGRGLGFGFLVVMVLAGTDAVLRCCAAFWAAVTRQSGSSPPARRAPTHERLRPPWAKDAHQEHCIRACSNQERALPQFAGSEASRESDGVVLDQHHSPATPSNPAASGAGSPQVMQ